MREARNKIVDEYVLIRQDPGRLKDMNDNFKYEELLQQMELLYNNNKFDALKLEVEKLQRFLKNPIVP